MSFGFGFGFPKNYVAALFNPRSLFAASEQGAWYDPSNLTTLFQDSAGTTPVTAVEQPVGLMLDKSKGLVLGPELVTNANTAASWVAIGNNTATQDGSAVKITYVDNNAGSLVLLNFGPLSTNLTVGKRYKVTFEAQASAGATVNIVATDGANSYKFSLTSTYQTFTVYINFLSGVPYVGRVNDGSFSPGEVYWVRNISVRELPGNHAFQTTSANRPVLSARVNLLTKTEDFSDAVWAKTAGASVSENQTTAPNGTLSADLLTCAAGSDWTRQPTAIPATVVRYTYAVYAKANASANFAVTEAGATGSSASFTLRDAGSVAIVNNGGSPEGTILSVGNGWYLCTFSYTSNGSQTTLFLNNSTTSNCYIWGADLRVTNTGVNLPPYQRVNTSTDYDTAGFPLYLKCNGTNTAMQTNSINFTGTAQMTVWAGVRKLSDSAVGMLVELSSSQNGLNNAFYISAPESAGVYGVRVGGAPGWNHSAFNAPISNVFSGAWNLRGATVADGVSDRINGALVQGSVVGTAMSQVNFGNYPLFLFARNASSMFFNGNFYGLIVRGAQSSAAEIANAETWMNKKTLAYAA